MSPLFQTITAADWARGICLARSTPNLIRLAIRARKEEFLARRSPAAVTTELKGRTAEHASTHREIEKCRTALAPE